MVRVLLVGLLAAALAAPADAAPLAEKYLLDGKLAEGEEALTRHLKENPKDDEARFGLAAVQFLRCFEKLGGALHRHGFKTTSNFPTFRALNQLVPENPRPEQLSHARLRAIVQVLLRDLERTGATLDDLRDDGVKLVLPVGRLKFAPFGPDRPVSAAILFSTNGMRAEAAVANDLVIAFDRGDACWLRGYCHFLSAWAELFLALDTKEGFDCTAHRFFARAESPHAFLREEKAPLGDVTALWRNFPALSDLIALFHLSLRVPVQDPARGKQVLLHLEGMVKNGKQMWKHILAETDDDREWVPNPKQQSVVPARVSEEMVKTWLTTLDEVEAVLQGKKLLPFWRGSPEKLATRGVNLRKAFTAPPKQLDIVLWVQGTAATPYLEEGTITALADPRTIARLNEAFGGFTFFGFALWFN